jgi:hypothetical protein
MTAKRPTLQQVLENVPTTYDAAYEWTVLCYKSELLIELYNERVWLNEEGYAMKPENKAEHDQYVEHLRNQTLQLQSKLALIRSLKPPQ